MTTQNTTDHIDHSASNDQISVPINRSDEQGQRRPTNIKPLLDPISTSRGMSYVEGNTSTSKSDPNNNHKDPLESIAIDMMREHDATPELVAHSDSDDMSDDEDSDDEDERPLETSSRIPLQEENESTQQYWARIRKDPKVKARALRQMIDNSKREAQASQTTWQKIKSYIPSLPTVSVSLDDSKGVGLVAKETITKVETEVKAFRGAMEDMLKSFLDDTKTNLTYMDMIENVISIITAVMAVWRAPDPATKALIITSFVTSHHLLTRLGTAGFRMIAEHISVKPDIDKIVGQVDVNEVATEGMFTMFVKLLAHTIGVGDLNPAHDDVRLSKLGKLGSAVRTVHDLMKYTMDLLRMSFEYIYEWYFGYAYALRDCPQIQMYTKMVVNMAVELRQIDPLKIPNVEAWYLKVSLAEGAITIVDNNSPIRDPKNVSPSTYHTARKEVLAAFAVLRTRLNASGERHRPVWVHIIGPPGQGKSGIKEVLAAAFMSSIYNIPYDSTRHVFERLTGTEYWEGYCNQPVISLDDIFQFDCSKKRAEEAVELIHMSNDTPFPLNMAQVDSKGRYSFTSKLIITTSNKRDWELIDITSREAIQRRIDVYIDATVKPGTNFSRMEDVDFNCYNLKMANDEWYKSYGVRWTPTTLEEIIDKISMLHHKRQNPRMDLRKAAKVFADKYLDAAKPILAYNKEIEVKGQAGAKKKTYTMNGHCAMCPTLPAIIEPNQPSPNMFLTTIHGHRFAICQKCCDILLDFRNDAGFKKYYQFESFYDGNLTHHFPRGVATITPGQTIQLVHYPPARHREEMIFLAQRMHLQPEQIMYIENAIFEPIKKIKGQMKRIIHKIQDNIDGSKAFVDHCIEGTRSDMFRSLQDPEPKNATSDIFKRIAIFSSVVASMAAICAGFYFFKKITTEDVIGHAYSAGDRPPAKKAYDNIPKSKRDVKKHVVPVNGQSNKAIADLCGIILENVCQVSVMLNNGTIFKQFVTFYCGKEGITSKHFSHIMNDPNVYNITVNRHFVNKNFTYDLKKFELKRADVVLMLCDGRDLGYIKINSNTFPEFKDIRNHFIDTTDELRDAISTHVSVGIKQVDEHRQPSILLMGSDRCKYVSALTYEVATVDSCEPMVNEELIEISGEGVLPEQGSCGSLYLTNNNKCQHKLLGIHVAGAERWAYCQIVYKSDLKDVFSDKVEGQMKIEIPNTIKHSILESKDQVRVASKSEIVPSLLYCRIEQPIRAPAVLTPTRRGNEMVSPAALALKKIDRPNVRVTGSDAILLKQCSKIVFESIPVIVKYKPLTVEQALNTPPGYTSVTPIRMDTSPGYPHNANECSCGCREKGRQKGKNAFIDIDSSGHRTPTDLLNARIAVYVHKLLNDPDFIFICSDSLKDELRSNEKVEACKTRLFSAMPVEVLVLLRMLCMDIMENHVRAHDNTYAKLGINPQSSEWRRLSNNLFPSDYQRERGIAGDIDAQDASTSDQMGENYIENITEHYEKYDVNEGIEIIYGLVLSKQQRAKLRQQLLKRCILNETWHVFLQFLYQTTHGNPSGFPLTTPFNSHNTACAILFSAAKFMQDIKKVEIELIVIWLALYLAIFGDDHVATFTRVLDGFGMGACKRYFALLGYNYTDVEKKGLEIIDESNLVANKQYYKRDELRFLKRKFAIGDGAIFAPLPLELVMDMTNWCSTRLPIAEATRQSAEACIRELYHFGREVFVEKKEQINRALRDVNLMEISISFDNLSNQFHGMHCATFTVAGYKYFDDVNDPVNVVEVQGQMERYVFRKRSQNFVDRNVEQMIGFAYEKQSMGAAMELANQFENTTNFFDFCGTYTANIANTPIMLLPVTVESYKHNCKGLMSERVDMYRDKLAIMYNTEKIQTEDDKAETMACIELSEKRRRAVQLLEAQFKRKADEESDKQKKPKIIGQMEVEQTQKSKQGVISGVLEGAATISNSIKSLPYVGTVASKASPILSVLASFAKSIGLDMPSNVSSVNRMIINQSSGLALAKGLDTVEQLAMDPTNQVSNAKDFYCEASPTCDFANYKLRPGLIQLSSFDATTTLNTAITSLPVTPTFCVAYPTEDNFAIHCLANYASCFRYWTGGMKYYILFVTSKMVSCRVRIEWFPDKSNINSVGNSDSGDIVSVTIDVCGTVGVPITIPYLRDQPYCIVPDPNEAVQNDNTVLPYCNGYLVIRMINPPIANSTTAATTVDFAIFVSGAEDFEAFRPTDDWNPYKYSPIPLSSLDEDYPSKPKIRGQMATTQATMQQIFRQQFPPIIPAKARLIDNVLQGEHVVNWVELFHRYTYLQFYSSASGASSNMHVDPWNSNSHPSIPLAQWDRFINSFNLHRGNFRIKVIQNDPTTTTQWSISNDIKTYVSTVPPNANYPYLNVRSGAVVNLSNFRGTVEAEIPFYGIFPFTSTQMTEERYEWPTALVATVEQGSNVTHGAFILVATGDNFSVGVVMPPGYFFINDEIIDKNNNRKIKGQMQKETFGLEERKGVETTTQETQEISGFRDTVGIKTAEVPNIISPVHRETNPYPDQGLVEVLSRPYLVPTAPTWTGSQTYGALVATGNYPEDLINVLNISEKLDRYTYFRAGVEVQMRVNSTVFHSGMLMIVFSPHWNFTTSPSGVASQNDIYSLSCMDFILLSANSGETISFQIPYVSPSSYFNLNNDSGVGDPWEGFIGQWRAYVLSPLRLTGASSTPSVAISVTSRFLQPEVTGMINRAVTPRLIQKEERKSKKNRQGCNVPKTTIFK